VVVKWGRGLHPLGSALERQQQEQPLSRLFESTSRMNPLGVCFPPLAQAVWRRHVPLRPTQQPDLHALGAAMRVLHSLPVSSP
jgi:hypothetical protein